MSVTTTRSLGGVTPPSRPAWCVALIGATADVVTTVVGLRVGLVEHNPVAVAVLSVAGVAALVAFKSAALGVVRIGEVLMPDGWGQPLPFAAGVLWGLVALWNVLLIGGVA